jgi:hypothetical protein
MRKSILGALSKVRTIFSYGHLYHLYLHMYIRYPVPLHGKWKVVILFIRFVVSSESSSSFLLVNFFTF